MFFFKVNTFALLFTGTESKKRHGVIIFWTTEAKNLKVVYGRLIDSIDFVCVNILYDVQRIYFIARKCILNRLDGNTGKADPRP